MWQADTRRIRKRLFSVDSLIVPAKKGGGMGDIPREQHEPYEHCWRRNRLRRVLKSCEGWWAMMCWTFSSQQRFCIAVRTRLIQDIGKGQESLWVLETPDSYYTECRLFAVSSRIEGSHRCPSMLRLIVQIKILQLLHFCIVQNVISVVFLSQHTSPDLPRLTIHIHDVDSR